MNTLTRSEQTEDIDLQRRIWLARNPGVLRGIAEEFNISPTFVTDIFRLRRNSKDSGVEKKLTELGAPGFMAAKRKGLTG